MRIHPVAQGEVRRQILLHQLRLADDLDELAVNTRLVCLAFLRYNWLLLRVFTLNEVFALHGLLGSLEVFVSELSINLD